MGCALRFTNVIQLKYELVPLQRPVCRGFVVGDLARKAEEGAWRMPWLTEAMKDVTSCENPGLGAGGL